MNRRLLAIVLALLPLSCADGCGCGGQDGPTVPEAATADAPFDAATPETTVAAPSPTAPTTAPATVTSDGSGDAGPAAAVVEGSGAAAVRDPSRFQRPTLNIRAVEPNRLPNSVAPRLTRPQIRPLRVPPTTTTSDP